MSKSTISAADGVSDRIKEERIRLNISQQQAADACNVRRETWGRYESGKMEMGSAVFRAYTLLGADPQYIVTGKRATDQEAAQWVRAVKFSDTRQAAIQGLTPALGALTDKDFELVAQLVNRLKSA